MLKILYGMLFILSATVFAAPPALGNELFFVSLNRMIPCTSEAKQLRNNIKRNYNESIVQAGIQEDGDLIELWTSKSTFTLILVTVIDKKPMLCIVSLGGDWIDLKPLDPMH